MDAASIGGEGWLEVHLQLTFGHLLPGPQFVFFFFFRASGVLSLGFRVYGFRV